jgi:hypothetical protein
MQAVAAVCLVNRIESSGGWNGGRVNAVEK